MLDLSANISVITLRVEFKCANRKAEIGRLSLKNTK